MENRIKNRIIGTLYVVATPIGNLEDITFRAVRILSEADLILCENTRHTIKLLNHLGIKNKLYSHHSYNERRNIPKVLKKLAEGLKIALVSDSGTPCISDPGSLLVSFAAAAGHNVIPIPGPSAFTSLLSVCGFPVNRFLFIGFLSSKKGKREKQLLSLVDFDGSIILYESPHRIEKLIVEIARFFKGRELVIARELTKKFEEIIKSKAEDLESLSIIKKGEYTIIIDNSKRGAKKIIS